MLSPTAQRWTVRGLLVALLAVGLSSLLALQQPTTAHAWYDTRPDNPPISAGSAAKKGSKLAPLRFLVGKHPAGRLLINTVGMGAAIWGLNETGAMDGLMPEGLDLLEDPIRGGGDEPWNPNFVNTNHRCSVHVIRADFLAGPGGWVSPTYEWSPGPAYREGPPPTNCPALADISQVTAMCRVIGGANTDLLVGTTHLRTRGWDFNADRTHNSGDLCGGISGATSDTVFHLVGVVFHAPAHNALVISWTYPSVHMNPDPGPVTDTSPLDGVVQLVHERICEYPDGSTQTLRTMADPGQIFFQPPGPCPEGSASIGARWLGGIGSNAATQFVMGEVGLDPAARTEYAQCLGTGAAGCDMRVELDGQECAYGVAGCEDWWSAYTATPERVWCQWGPYRLPGFDCQPLRHAYVTPHGAVTDPDRPATSMPVPIVEPPSKPWPKDDPLPGAPAQPVPTPGWQCPPSGLPIENGLQPVALYGMRCAVFEYPAMSPTSGVRADGSTPSSDHPSGLAVDFGVPNWDQDSGNAAGWEFANWTVSNADALYVKYVIFDNKRWPAYDGANRWVPYSHPSGESNPSLNHENHVHVSYSGQPGGRPNPGTNPGTPTIPENGTNPEGEGQDCLGAEWSWNPVSWVYAPVKCATIWAFQPSEGAFENKVQPISNQFAATPVGGWIAAPGELVGELGALQADGCQGPAVTIPLPEILGGTNHTIHPLDACSQPMATVAQITRVLLTVALYIGALVGSLSLMGSAFGLNHQYLAYVNRE